MTLTSNKISPAAQKDILELERRIGLFKQGLIPDERFKAFRLTRGVYGQRQLGVQMLRLKLPYGKINAEQFLRIAEVSEKYTNGNLHATTRQNFQLHFVHLEDSPEIWAKLEETGVTTREACGNTVRNVTASALAGIDPDEPFNVSPYVDALFAYFLRNPICQDLGRKIKIAFSSSDKDSAFTYIHDFGFIPKIQTIDGQERRGFKVVIAGGLGAQAILAKTAYEFLPEEKIIPFVEAALRVFDRYGEREKRHKARLKFLLEEGRGFSLEQFLELVEKEQKANKFLIYPIDISQDAPSIPKYKEAPTVEIKDLDKYDLWLKTNVIDQKQEGFHAIKVRLPLGNIHAEKVKELIKITAGFVADDIRITVNQGLLFRFVRKEHLPYLFYSLNHIGLAEIGADSIADIAACPGTDTCNLGVTNSTTISEVLEDLIQKEFHSLITDSDIHIKISGCMNSCGQHMIANIGFHGSSIKNGALVIPALQVVLGGGVDEFGEGYVADKVIKLPTKKIPDAVRALLNDYQENSFEGEYFNVYYLRHGKIYFYDLLKPFADVKKLSQDEYSDWGQTASFIPEIGTGECAGVSVDVVGNIINDAREKLGSSLETLINNYYTDSIYHSYSSFVIGAKALLLSKDIRCNTHIRIIRDFKTHYIETGEFVWDTDFEKQVLQINENAPSPEFAESFFAQAQKFIEQVGHLRQQQLAANQTLENKEVIANFYKA